MSYLALSASFERYGYIMSTVIINILLFQCGDRLTSVPALKKIQGFIDRLDVNGQLC